ncbi:hypothetical protein [Streptomyces sp. LN245]|uniref:hypothetical protein n=1 Tax=Streptomyces sp. LN245 TaxID=3112975 RepID=UPI0037184FD4
MSTRKAPPTKQPPKLEGFYNVGEAAVRLNVKTQEEHEAGSTKGERWLRDGVNHKGWPCHRLNSCLMFSDSDLMEIAARNRNVPTRAGRPRRKPAAPRGATATPAPIAA